jgi:hypothetical protein
VFDDPSFTASAGATRAIALGDLDGDGDLDIASASDDGNRIWLNDGTGIFTLFQQIPAGSTFALALGDLDGDGDLDLVEGNFSENVLGIFVGKPERLLLNDGLGVFTDSGERLGTGFTRSVALGDLDGDLDLDIVVGNQGGDRVFLNEGGADFRGSGQVFAETRTSSVALGDVDGDGDLDLAEGNFALSLSSGTLGGEPDRILENNARGRFQLVQQVGNEETAAVVLADLDADGDPDLATGREDGIDIHANEGGRFRLSGSVSLLEEINALATGDVDLDGDLDLVSGSERGTRVSLNDGTGSFAPEATSTSARTFSVALGDLNNDGDLDLVTGEEDGFRVLPQ